MRNVRILTDELYAFFLFGKLSARLPTAEFTEHVLFDGDPDELCLTGENVDAVL